MFLFIQIYTFEYRLQITLFDSKIPPISYLENTWICYGFSRNWGPFLSPQICYGGSQSQRTLICFKILQFFEFAWDFWTKIQGEILSTLSNFLLQLFPFQISALLPTPSKILCQNVWSNLLQTNINWKSKQILSKISHKVIVRLIQ